MTNGGLIRLSRALTVFASASFLSGISVAVIELGDYADQLRALGIAIPKKLAAILLLVSALGQIAAKISKTPSKSIAAAVPPTKSPATPGGTALVLLLAVTITGLTSCYDPGTGGFTPSTTPVSYCPDAANEAANLNGLMPPYPGLTPTTSIELCGKTDSYTHFGCALCRDADGVLALLEPGDVRCSQDTARTGAATAAKFVVCVVACTDPDCQ